MKPVNSPWNAEQHAHMRMRQAQNKEQCKRSRAEDWMYAKLKATRWKWTRQAQRGFRLFDFWCHEIGVAIEVDGPEHDATRDYERDQYNFSRSAIVVLRVPNFDEEVATKTIAALDGLETHKERRRKMGIA